MAPNNEEHGDILRRLESLEKWREDMNDFFREQAEARLTDFKDHTERLSEIHNKVNSSNDRISEVKVELHAIRGSVRGWATGAVAAASVATGIIVFLLDKLFP